MAFEEYSRAFGSDSRLGGLNKNDSAVNSGPSFARNKSESFFLGTHDLFNRNNGVTCFGRNGAINLCI